METIGKVNSPNEHITEWVIQNFFSLSRKDCKCYTSHTFSFNGEFWYLTIYPNGQKKHDSVGYVDLYLHRKTSGSEINQHFSFSLKNSSGQKEEETHYRNVFKEADEGFGSSCFISREKLSRRKYELLPATALTVICTLNYPESTENASLENPSSHEKKCKEKPIRCPECSDIVLIQNWYDHECQKERSDGLENKKKCSYCHVIFKTSMDFESHQQKCLEKPIKCTDCSHFVELKNWYDHKCHTEGEAKNEKMMLDFKTIMLNGNHSDTIVKVKDEEFKLHKIILAARNPYFNSMFSSDMKEKATGIVNIEDCKPDIFRSFIHFLYTGKVDKLSPENVCDLYEAADKYQEDQLKKECLYSMLTTLSVDSFCNYFVLALEHNEKELFHKAVNLFIIKGKEIAHSVKWQTFVKEYPIQANELFIKTLDRYVR